MSLTKLLKRITKTFSTPKTATIIDVCIFFNFQSLQKVGIKIDTANKHYPNFNNSLITL